MKLVVFIFCFIGFKFCLVAQYENPYDNFKSDKYKHIYNADVIWAGEVVANINTSKSNPNFKLDSILKDNFYKNKIDGYSGAKKITYQELNKIDYVIEPPLSKEEIEIQRNKDSIEYFNDNFDSIRTKQVIIFDKKQNRLLCSNLMLIPDRFYVKNTDNITTKIEKITWKKLNNFDVTINEDEKKDISQYEKTFFPIKNLFGLSLSSILLSNLMKNKFQIYSLSKTKINYQTFIDDNFPTDTIWNAGCPTGVPVGQIVQYVPNYESVNKVKLLENLYYSDKTKQIKVDIIAACLYYDKYDPATGDFIKTMPLVWIVFDKINPKDLPDVE